MKIAIPTADYPPIEGGIASVTLHLSRALAELGHDVTVIAPWFDAIDALDDEEPVEVIRYRGYSLGWLRFIPMFVTALSPMRRADLVLAINVSHGGIMAWLTGMPYITFAYAYEFLKFQKVPLVGGMLRRVYNGSQCVVSISRFTSEQLETFGVDRDRIKTIFPGVPMPEEVDRETLEAVRGEFTVGNRPLLLSAGRLIERKGFMTLLDSMPEILEQHPGALLIIAGRGPLQESLRKRVVYLGIEDAVRLTGYVEDNTLAALYTLCEVFVMPTGEDARGQVEGFGLVFAEANSYGKPVVAGRSGGVVDAIIDGTTGILVEPNDAAACANAVMELLDDPSRARAMGDAGRRRVEAELRWDSFAEAVVRAADGGS